MPVQTDNSVTLRLNGSVLLDEFADGVDRFRQIVDGLTKAIARNEEIEWAIGGLFFAPSQEFDVAKTTALGHATEAKARAAIWEVVTRYERIGMALRSGRPLPSEFPKVVRQAADDLRSMINGKIRSITFETPSKDIEIKRIPQPEQAPQVADVSFGAIEGRVETISRRGQLHFTIYDRGFDSPVSCYVSSGMEEQMKTIWGRMVMVEGMVRRDPETDRPTAIRDVRAIVQLREAEDWNYESVVGISPWKAGERMPEDTIRQLRDEQE